MVTFPLRNNNTNNSNSIISRHLINNKCSLSLKIMVSNCNMEASLFSSCHCLLPTIKMVKCYLILGRETVPMLPKTSRTTIEQTDSGGSSVFSI